MAASDPQARIATLEMALRTSSRELHWAQLTIQKKDAVIRIRPTNPGQTRAAFQRAGVSGATSDSFR
jgi:hypothetical protein